MTIDCDYLDMECDNLRSDCRCARDDDDGDGECPGEMMEAENDEERE